MGEDAFRLPHYATLPVRVALWGVIVAVLAAAGLALTASVPQYASGDAVVVDTADGPVVTAVFASGVRPQLHVGDVLSVTFDPSPEPVVTRIGAVQPLGQGATGAECFPGLLAPAPAAAGDLPMAAVAPLPASATGIPPRSAGRAAVEIGRVSLFTWVTS